MANRATCLDCVRKHLGQAYVLLSEYADDTEAFEEYFYYAMGHLAEACDECKNAYPFVGQVLRAHRRKMMEDDDYWIDFKPLIRWINRLAFLENDIEFPDGELEQYIEESIEPVKDLLGIEEEKPTKTKKSSKQKNELPLPIM